jgi:hypothetical protein
MSAKEKPTRGPPPRAVDAAGVVGREDEGQQVVLLRREDRHVERSVLQDEVRAGITKQVPYRDERLVP